MFRALFRVFDYSGRSTRWEYWSFFIGLVIVALIAGVALAAYRDAHGGLVPPLTEDTNGLLALGLIGLIGLPNLALKVRRYHDFGWSGWAVLWSAVPLVNIFMELMLLSRGPVAPTPAYAADYEPRPITIYNTPGAMAGDYGRQGAPADQIARLADLHAQGMLTAQEFAIAKAKVLRP